MPGIITHNKVFAESIKLLSKRKHPTYLLRSIASLFNSVPHYRSGLFGAIGPDIFDYIPPGKSDAGNRLSFMIHDGGAFDLIKGMRDTIFSYRDKNNEWASTQRAYLYGFISHIIADSFFHPFVFYWSGFPDSNIKEEKNFFREQNLLFQYNLDNYYFFYEKNSDQFNFSLNEMLPLKGKGLKKKIDPAIKSLILQQIFELYPSESKKIIHRGKSESPFVKFGYFDMIPFSIKAVYRLKRTENRKIITVMEKIKGKNLFFSDLLIRYPEKRKYNDHVLNFHKESWHYPAEKPGFYYDSVDDIMQKTCEKIVDMWEIIESSLYSNKKTDMIEDLNINSYTGEKGKGYYDMKLKSPVKMR